MLKDKLKTVLIIGGTGTLGKELVSRFLNLDYKVIVMSRDEEKHYWMQQDYPNNENIKFKIGDIRNYSDVCSVIKDAQLVINCAAIKQVPLSEYNPMQAVLTNIIGLANIVRAISEHDYLVDTVVSISSDKACNAISVMGMTKAIGEKIIIAASKSIPKTRFICLRCGNFSSSNGSVVELFRKQIDKGGPVTVTHKDMIRYFVELVEVCNMLIVALSEARSGEIYITNVNEVRIMDLVKQMIGEKDIKIKFIGIRPGEKLKEEMISKQETEHCIIRNGYKVIQSCLTI